MHIESSYSLATQAFHKENITYEEYQNHYKQNNGEDEWLKRKVEALPCMFIAVVVKTTYHVAIAIIVGIPQCLTCDTKNLRTECSNIYHDLEEAYAFVIMIFDDQKGSFYFERSQFFKEKNIVVLKKDQDFKPSSTKEPKTPDPKTPNSEKPSTVQKMKNVAVSPVKGGESWLLEKENTIFEWLLIPQNWDWFEKNANRFEYFFQKTAHADPSVFSSSAVLFLQDLQVIKKQINQGLEIRKSFYNRIEAFPQLLVDSIHGDSQRRVQENPFAPILSPIAWKVSEGVISKKTLMKDLQENTKKLVKDLKERETTFFHATFPTLIKKSITGTASHIGEQSIKWYACHTVVWLSSCVISLVSSSLQNKDETMEQSYLINPWWIGLIAYLYLFNTQLKSWKAHHEKTHSSCENDRNSIAYKMRDRLAAEFTSTTPPEKENGAFEKVVLPHIMEILADNISLPQTDHKPPPSETIWRKGWNYVKSFSLF